MASGGMVVCFSGESVVETDFFLWKRIEFRRNLSEGVAGDMRYKKMIRCNAFLAAKKLIIIYGNLNVDLFTLDSFL